MSKLNFFPKTIIINSVCPINIFNTFTVFRSVENIIYLIYTDLNNSIIAYNLINYQKINELKQAHINDITSFRHYQDKINRRDLIASMTFYESNIKIWDIKNFVCLYSYQERDYLLYSGNFLYDNTKIFFMMINSKFDTYYNPIKVFDLNGKKIKEIKNSNEQTIIIETFYDKKLSANFIITGNNGYVKSYKYKENQLYKIYKADDQRIHSGIIIYDNENEKIIRLIEASNDGHIRIWTFHTAILLKKIDVNNKCYNKALNCICLFNNDYLFVGCGDGKIILFELKSGKTIQDLVEHQSRVMSMAKLSLPEFGECLISQCVNGNIILWINLKK